MRKDPKLGDTLARLSELSAQDLSDDKEIVDRLLGVLKANLPFKLFGLALHQNDQILHHTIQALSGTPAPAVRAALEEVVSRFPDKEIAKAAARVLAGFRRAATAAAAGAAEAAAPASLNGDLEVFGLPALLQSLSDSGMSGSLTLAQSPRRGLRRDAPEGGQAARLPDRQSVRRGRLLPAPRAAGSGPVPVLEVGGRVG